MYKTLFDVDKMLKQAPNIHIANILKISTKKFGKY